MNVVPIFFSSLLLATASRAQFGSCNPKPPVQDNYDEIFRVEVRCGNNDVTFEWQALSQDIQLVYQFGYECTDPDGNTTSGDLQGSGSPPDPGPTPRNLTVGSLLPNTTCVVTGCYEFDEFFDVFSFPSENCTVLPAESLSPFPSSSLIPEPSSSLIPEPSSSLIPEMTFVLQTRPATHNLHMEQSASLPSPIVATPSPQITESRGQISNTVVVIAVVISTVGALIVLVFLLICCVLILKRKPKNWYGDLYKEYDTEKIDLKFCPIDTEAKMTPAVSVYSIYYSLDWDYIRAKNATFETKPEEDDEVSTILLSGSKSQNFDTGSCKSVLMMSAENSANEALETAFALQTTADVPSGYIQEKTQGNANFAAITNPPVSTFEVSNEIQVSTLPRSRQTLLQNSTPSGYVQGTTEDQLSIAVAHSHGSSPVSMAATGSVNQSGYIQEGGQGDSNLATVSVEIDDLGLAYDGNGLENEMQVNAQSARQAPVQKSAGSGYLPDPSNDQSPMVVPVPSHPCNVPTNSYVRDPSDIMDNCTHYQEAAADQFDLYDVEEFEPMDRIQSQAPTINNDYMTETNEDFSRNTVTASTNVAITSEYVSEYPTSVLQQPTPPNPANTGVLEDTCSIQPPHFATTSASNYLQSERADLECFAQTQSNTAVESDFSMADILCSEDSWECTSEPQSISLENDREATTDYISSPPPTEEAVSMGQYLAADTCYCSETAQEAIDSTLYSETSAFAYSPSPSLDSPFTSTSNTADKTPCTVAAGHGYVVTPDSSVQGQESEQSLSDTTDLLSSFASSSDIYETESDTPFISPLSTSKALGMDFPLPQTDEVVPVDSNPASGYVSSSDTSGVSTSSANLVEYPIHSGAEKPCQLQQQSNRQTPSVFTATESLYRASGSESAAQSKKSSSKNHKSPSKIANSPPSRKHFLSRALSSDSDYFSEYSSSTPACGTPVTPGAELFPHSGRAANAFPLGDICRATESDSADDESDNASGHTNSSTSLPSAVIRVRNANNSVVIPSLLGGRDNTVSLPCIKELPTDMTYDSECLFTGDDLVPTTPDSETHDGLGSEVVLIQPHKVVDNPLSHSSAGAAPLRAIVSSSSSGYLGSISSNESTISSDDAFLAESYTSIHTPGYVGFKASNHGQDSAHHVNSNAGTSAFSFLQDNELEITDFQEDDATVLTPAGYTGPSSITTTVPSLPLHYAASSATTVIPSLIGRYPSEKQTGARESLENISRQSFDALTPTVDHHITEIVGNGYIHV